jgi:hypothetical protein
MARREDGRRLSGRGLLTAGRSHALALAAFAATIGGGGSLRGQAVELRIGERWATTASADSGQFVAVHGMTETPDGHIWVADGRLGVIRILSPRGHPLDTRGQRGDGPGEFQVPGRMLTLPDGSLAMHDVARGSVELFDGRGQWVRRIGLSARIANPKGFAALPHGGWVLSGGIPGNPYAIHLFDPDGVLRTSWFPVPRTDNPRAGMLVAGGPVAVVGDSGVLFARAAPHGVYRFSAPGAEPVVLSALRDLVPPIGDEFIQEQGTGAGRVRTFQWYFPQSRAVFPVGAGRVLNVITRYEHEESVWLLFGPDGGLIAATAVPVAYEPWSLTADGDVLASYREPNAGEILASRLRVQVATSAPGAPDPASVLLEPIVVTAPEAARPVARLRGYYQRLELRQGQFVTRQEIERRRPLRLWQMLYGLSGLQISPVQQTIVNTRVVATSLGGQACEPAVYLDAMHLTGRAFGLVDALSPNDIEGIEFFRGPAETPVEFSGLHALCGVIAVWTRSGG